MDIKARLNRTAFESQTVSLQNAPFGTKLLAFIYRLIGRKLLARLLYSTEACTGCGTCAVHCPKQAISIKRNNPRRNDACRGCFACIYHCPHRAIELHAGTLAGIVALLFLPYDTYIRSLFAPFIAYSVPAVINIVLSIALWCVGYFAAMTVFKHISFMFSTLLPVKMIRKRPFIKRLNIMIHPARIFPVILRSPSPPHTVL